MPGTTLLGLGLCVEIASVRVVGIVLVQRVAGSSGSKR